MRELVFIFMILAVIVTCADMSYKDAHASGSECRNDETGEVRTFDGPCPSGWHPTGGWVQ